MQIEEQWEKELSTTPFGLLNYFPNPKILRTFLNMLSKPFALIK